MRWGFILKVVGILVILTGLAMTIPLAWSLWYKEDAVVALLQAMGVCLAAGLAVVAGLRCSTAETITQREAMAIVAVGWTAVGLAGALPFWFSGHFGGFTDAFFESVSGFTTTGSSILTDTEVVPKGLLLWRSLIQWLGGMGIIVLSVAILPFIGVGGMQLYKAEVPSPVPDKLKPRIRDTAMIMWKVYLAFTLAEVGLLMAGGMNFFDALNHGLTTMPTGGFSTRNASVTHYASTYIDMVIIVFMILAGINFSLHYQFLRGKTMAFWRDRECRFFIGTLIVLTALVTIDVFGPVYDSFGDALRYSSFQVVSIITTTGYATADYEKWPAMSQLILLICMFLGASAGSTGGGVKALRVMLCFKYCYREFIALIHPRAVIHVKLAGKTVPDDVMHAVMGFLALYVCIFALGSVVLAGMGVDFVTSFGAVAACLGNIGPGFGQVGPVDNFAAIPVAGKWLLIWCMLLGRLEIYTVIILLVPAFWRR